MTTAQWITFGIAAYGALLATVNAVLQFRSKRWRPVVTHSYRQQRDRSMTVSVRVSNLGERPVYVADIFIEWVILKVGYRDRFRQWLRSLRSERKGRVHMISSRVSLANSKPDIKLPHELKPGDSMECEFGHGEPLPTPLRASAGMVDAVGRIYRGKQRVILTARDRGQVASENL